jgi:hypothetical protein
MDDKSSKELKKVDSNLGRVDKAAKKSSQGIKGMNKQLLGMGLAVGGAVTGAVALGKALWALGGRGAVVQQTEDSFDGLVRKLKVTPDLLERQREAVRGTVDDMTLMSATQTLLAGTTDEVGKELAEATPKLLEIAKAANKLNPSLGDTAFLYESITAGIKRGSPQVLDNLGIIVKLGKAQSDYADKLGVTVEELTAEQKTLALLNDVSERAGDILIEQAGGVDALGDSMARAEVKAKNLSDTIAKKASPAIERLADKGLELLDWMSRYEEGLVAINAAQDEGIITEEDAARLREDYLSDIITIENVLWNLGMAQDHYNRAVTRTSEEMGHLVRRTQAGVIPGLRETEGALDDSGEAAGEFAGRMLELNRSTAESLSKLREYNRELREQKISDYFDVDMGVGDLAAQLFDVTRFKELGGEGLSALVGEVQSLLVDNIITPEQAREFWKNIAIEAAAIEIELGDIDIGEAAESISEEFNVPLEEAQGLIEGVLGGIDLINMTDLTAVKEEFDALQERRELLEGEFDIFIDADPGDVAQQELDNLEGTLFDLTGEPWQIDVKINKDKTNRSNTIKQPNSIRFWGARWC